MRVPCTAVRSNQSVQRAQPLIFIGRTDAKDETPKLGHLMRIANPLEKTLMMGKIEGRWNRGHRG